MKDRSNFNIVFMGTPDFAVASLKNLHESGYAIVGVVTAPDKPAGRGQQIQQSAVKKYALAHGLTTLQPTSLKDPEFLTDLKNLQADLFVVVAFRMLPEVVWQMPTKGTINLHGSLLPKYRGAAPINWAIMNGEKETGVSTFFIEKEIDTGKVIQQATIPIGPNDHVGKIHDQLMEVGADLMLQTVDAIRMDTIQPRPQSDFEGITPTLAPKIFKATTQIDFQKQVQDVHNFCRGLDPYPGAWTLLKNNKNGELKSFKLFETRITEIPSTPNATIYADKDGIYIPTQDFYLKVGEIQMEGKRRMDYKSFLAGNNMEDWSLILGEI